ALRTVLVVTREQFRPLVVAERASGFGDFGQFPEVVLPGRRRSEEDEHGRGFVSVVAERVYAVARHVKEVARPRTDPLRAVVETDRAGDHVEGLREGLVEMRVRAASARRQTPLEEAELTVGHDAGRDEAGRRTSAVVDLLDVGGRTETRRRRRAFRVRTCRV